MKVGILTYHRAISYGAILQAIATRTYFESLGNEAYFVDYFPDYHRSKYRLFNISSLKRINVFRSLLDLYDSIAGYSVRKQRLRVFHPFIEEYIEPFCLAFDKFSDFDLIVYGSDQIWRKQPGLGMRFNPVYFGERICSQAKKISFAASMGIINLNADDKLFLKKNLSCFNKVGVRESSLQRALDGIGISATHNIDPTFLLNSNQWDLLLKTKRLIDGEYALYYKVGYGLDENKIEQYCARKKLKLIKVYSFEYSSKSDFNPDPSEFASLVKYASFVFTTSFHGLAFSLIYRKQFIVSCEANSERLKSLLFSLGLNGRFVNKEDVFEKVCEKAIDYSNIESCLDILIEKSKRFLLDI